MEICATLAREPFHLTPDQVKKLTPYQVYAIYGYPCDEHGQPLPSVNKGAPEEEWVSEAERRIDRAAGETVGAWSLKIRGLQMHKDGVPLFAIEQELRRLDAEARRQQKPGVSNG